MLRSCCGWEKKRKKGTKEKKQENFVRICHPDQEIPAFFFFIVIFHSNFEVVYDSSFKFQVNGN